MSLLTLESDYETRNSLQPLLDSFLSNLHLITLQLLRLFLHGNLRTQFLRYSFQNSKSLSMNQG
jgi:hypothetical protein